MLDRIKALMAARQLSASQFADLTTLPRPVVSHILSGRNKPSLEAAQKIMAAFPDVSVDWLLNGRGEMLVAATESASASASTPPASKARPAAERAPREKQAPAHPIAAPTTIAPPPAPQPAVVAAPPAEPVAPPTYAAAAESEPQASYATYAPPPVAPMAAPPAAPAPPAPLSPPVPAPVQQVLRPERVVRRILVFYSDGTFSDHRPLPADEAPFF